MQRVPLISELADVRVRYFGGLVNFREELEKRYNDVEKLYPKYKKKIRYKKFVRICSRRDKIRYSLAY